MTTKKIIYEVNNLLISIENKSNSEQPISIFYPAINRFKENNLDISCFLDGEKCHDSYYAVFLGNLEKYDFDISSIKSNDGCDLYITQHHIGNGEAKKEQISNIPILIDIFSELSTQRGTLEPNGRFSILISGNFIQ